MPLATLLPATHGCNPFDPMMPLELGAVVVLTVAHFEPSDFATLATVQATSPWAPVAFVESGQPDPTLRSAIPLLACWGGVAQVTGLGSGTPGDAIRREAASNWAPRNPARLAVADGLEGMGGEKPLLVFVQWPLPYHPHARRAAAFAACTARSGTYLKVHDLLFAAGEGLGSISAREIAAQAGIPDWESYAACTRSYRTQELIDRGVGLAGRIGANGTPAVVVNGFLLRREPMLVYLDSLLEINRDGS